MANVPFDIHVEEAYIRAGVITRRKHPEFDLWILNYTTKATISRDWDNITLTCRGLIYNATRRAVAWPFRKFFNLQELKEGAPNGNFQLYDKADGSRGISYPGPDGQMYIATRGSFESEQAKRGSEFLKRQYGGKGFAPAITYLFEI